MPVRPAVRAGFLKKEKSKMNIMETAITVGVWAVYLAVLLLRWRARLVSVRFAWVCLVMFILALLSLGPVNSSRPHQVTLTPEER